MALALDLLLIAVLGLLPISELRGAIPYGFLAGLNPALVFIIAVASNILVIPIVYFFLDYIHNHLLAISIYRNFVEKFIERTRKKAHPYIAKYGYLGLAIFVGIPLPVTGAYTGTLAAWLLGMERKKAMLALALGVVMAGVIVTAIMMTGAKLTIFIGKSLFN